MVAWQTLDLASAVQLGAPDAGAGNPNYDGPFGVYSAGTIHSRTGWLSPDFYFPGLSLNPTTTYQVEVTFDPAPTYDDPGAGAPPGGRYVFIAALRIGHEVDDYTTLNYRGDHNGGPLAENAVFGPDVQVFTFGPGNSAWDDPVRGVVAGFTTPFFETDVSVGVSQVRISPPVGSTIVPPLRQYPRSDGLAASSAPRKWPLPPTIQASNRRFGVQL